MKKEKFNWIPCSKKLPNESGYYLACIYDTEAADYDFRKIWFAYVDDYNIEKSEWRELYKDEVVTAWVPLPEPYRKSENTVSLTSWRNKMMNDFMKGVGR